MNGTHSTDVFAIEAERMILNHDIDKPMFMYILFKDHIGHMYPTGTEEIHEYIPESKEENGVV